MAPSASPSLVGASTNRNQINAYQLRHTVDRFESLSGTVPTPSLTNPVDFSTLIEDWRTRLWWLRRSEATAMGKKLHSTTATTPSRRILRFGLKSVFVSAFLIGGLTLLWLNSLSESNAAHDDARRMLRYGTYDGPDRVAFLFLARRSLPLDFLWGSFFEGAEEEMFSIYIHSEPGFAFDESTTRSPCFYGRELKNSIQVRWGEASMIEAERLLLEVALEEPANQRFILLSDSCVPLYNFNYIYNYVMVLPKSFVDSFLDVKENRYHPKMAPVIPKNKWRKGSQWVTLIRSHAEVIADDQLILPAFEKYCKLRNVVDLIVQRRPPIDASKGILNNKLQKQHNCIPDEHYVQTLLTLKGLENELERRTLTYTVWNQSKTKTETRGWHPKTFSYADARPEIIKGIKEINHINYETEDRTEWCQVNSTSVPCFLFARKFSRPAAMRLLSEGVVASFNASSLLEKFS